MAKKKLQVTYDYDFTLLALNANVKPYRLAWSINKELKLDLSKCENIEIDFKSGRELNVVNYIDLGEYRTIRLLRNRAEESEEQFDAFLIPELKNFDYFIILENESSTFDENAFISKIKEIPFVQFATKVEIEALKSRDNLIF
ncbi:IPExxxVDY family protein [Roseivirga sp. E12]|uniref:IPExxxVDY family protein n=1 Tax=Roseivirga sp. E12 TaxID=2819237 RepID=UPI001ABC1056|nr:IPExxxVDY family protein [Roseivirga sp. E12]MBO3698003.1 IPExxxVDY family protein [Roseivirga sp. E12]